MAANFYYIVAHLALSITAACMAPLQKEKIVCPQGSDPVMDYTNSRPCFKFVEYRMNYFMASKACKARNGYIPGINSNFKDISITSLAQNIFLLYNEDYFWLGCYMFNDTLTCEDETDLNGYENWANDNDPSRGSCVVVSLSTGRWRNVDCLQSFVFPCKYKPANADPIVTPTSEGITDPPILPYYYQPQNYTIVIKIPNYTGLLWGLFALIVFIFIFLQCLCCQCFRCLDNLGYFTPRRRRSYDYPERYHSPGRRRSRILSQISSRYNDFHYSPSPSEETRLLEEQELRERTFSNFSSNPIPSQNLSPPRSVIIRIPSQVNPTTTNIEELLQLHGHYRNFPSLDRSEISSILQTLPLRNYIPRSERDYTLPPPDPLYSIDSCGNINIDLCRISNISPLPSPPPYQSYLNLTPGCQTSSPLIDPAVAAAESPIDLSFPPLPLPRIVEYNETAARIRRAQNRRNLSEEERILKKQIY